MHPFTRGSLNSLAITATFPAVGIPYAVHPELTVLAVVAVFCLAVVVRAWLRRPTGMVRGRGAAGAEES